MKKIILLTYFVFFQLLLVTAQSKVNFVIAQQIQKKNTTAIDVFIKGNVDRIKELLESNDGTFKRSAGNIVIAHLTFPQIAILLQSPGVERIEAYPQHTIPMNDTMLINNNVIPVHNGQSPLLQGYDGKGVIVGIIDTGLDFTHPDFIDSTGRSRVKFYWDQSQPNGANTPVEYGYGLEWDNIQIDSGKAIAGTDPHGTHVTGIAVGNGRAVNNYKGVAPAADIIAVSLDFSSLSPTIIAEAVDYIYSRAQLLGKPCVINASIGDYLGSHDGQDLQAQFIGSLIDQKKGRVFVASAGNKGNSPIHLGYTVTADTNFTFFKPSQGYVYMAMWADTTVFKNVNFAIGCDQLSPVYSFRGRTAFTNIVPNVGTYRLDSIYINGKRLGYVESYGDLVGGTYSMEYQIIPDSMSYVWRLITTGSGKFDLWNTDNIFTGTLPPATVMKDSVFYKRPDFDQTIVSSYQCLDNVITVGNYANRKTYLDYNHNPYYGTGTPGKRFPTSSCGPTRDGRIKPDIIAPGDVMLSALVQSLRPQYIALLPTSITPEAYHTRDGGTSSSGPGVAGIAALYLQKHPTATAIQVKNAILNCSRQDAFTGITPNNAYGYGKADAFKTLTACTITGIDADNNKEALSFNIYPNPARNGTAVHIDASLPAGTFIQRLEIYTEMGARVLTLTSPKTEIELTKQLAPGIYFCKLITNTQAVTTKKLVIL